MTASTSTDEDQNLIEDQDLSESNRSDGRSMSMSISSAEGAAAMSVATSDVDQLTAESKWLARARFFVLLFLFVVAGSAAGLTFYFVSSSESKDFEAKGELFALQISESTEQASNSLFGVIESMASTITAYGRNSGDETQWPMQTYPGFELVASNFRNVSGVRSIITAPIVSETDKASWETYSVNNAEEWIQESKVIAGKVGGVLDADTDIGEVSRTIFEFNDDGEHVNSKNAPYAPMWQVSTVPDDTTLINFNLFSNQVFSKTFQLAAENQQAVLSEVLDMNELFGGSTWWKDDNEEGPESVLINPIYDDDTPSTSNDRKVVGALISVVSWDSFFADLHQDDVMGMVAILSNTCGQRYTYKLDKSSGATYLGPEDKHNTDYDSFLQMAQISPRLEDIEASESFCSYFVDVYPSHDLKDEVCSYKPILYTTVIVVLFVVAAAVFVMYDCLVQRRQQEAMNTAVRSNAIVSSLFPAEIRDRLFKGDEGEKSSANIDIEIDEDDDDPQLEGDRKENETDQNVPEAQKFRLKNYLTEEEVPNDKTLASSKAMNNTDKESKPIADLFPHTTVMFADIAGFTAWSSVREPSQVFTLLETVYKAFDTTAKRRKVFKVETVGDCYVAVTGLPEPIKDHAVVMSRFARECLTQFNKLAQQLEVLLGPDTAELDIRVGLHSGPVTAGVLRGDKSRFQLFGDTVNTAARVESTGLRNRIHISLETAQQLHAAGKSNWVSRRTDTVVAKGKGEMQTFWLLTNEELASGEGGDTTKAAPLPVVKAVAPRIAATAHDVLDPESTLPPKIKRLVDWNVDVLKRLLKQIIAKRNASENKNFEINDHKMMTLEVDIGCDTYVLDEVKEIIYLPKFDQKAYKKQENPNKIKLPKDVEDQLRLYVSSIAAMHRDNPFHNFEHASHVMMSVSKLLSRIVAPDEVLNQEKEGAGNSVATRLHDHTYGITSDPLTQFSVVLAALIHDVDHSGVSNFQLIKENAKIASVFKNKSVAEQNSIVLAWERLMESRFVALRGCIYSSPAELKRFRQLMVNTVLATDIFDKELQALRKNRWVKAFRLDDESESSERSNLDEKEVLKDVNRKATIVLEHLIQASDVAHTMQHWHIYQKWNERLFFEMTVAHRSGRMEKDPALGWYKGELGFFDNYVIPLAKKLKDCGVFGVSSDEYLNYALENRREWSRKGEEVVEMLIKKYGDHSEESERGEEKKI